MRKKTEWTNEMDKFLVKAGVTLKEFANKYGIAVSVACKRRQELLEKLESGEDEVEVLVESNSNKIEETVEEKLNIESEDNNILKIIPSIILDINALVNQGVRFYITNSIAKMREKDLILSDLQHKYEESVDEMSTEDFVALGKKLGLTTRQRRLYKDEIDFINNNKIDCENFVKFIKTLQLHSQGITNRKYNNRILKEEFGIQSMVSDNNIELITLRERVRELENVSNNDISDELVDYMLKCEKLQLKQDRIIARNSGTIIPTDELVDDWRIKFNELDEETRRGLLGDGYAMYRTGEKPKHKRLEDFVVWNSILPIMLWDKKYFLKKDVK